jgi:arylsulfatase A-like enzyme
MGRTAQVIALLMLALLPGMCQAAETTRPPNVVLVMTDDQGYGDIAAHGNTVIRTPNLDRLHSQSARLTNFHVDPTCSPTRAALMTGRYSSRSGVWHTIAGRSMLRRDERTMADHFAAAGYTTGIFGKWHLGDNYPFRAQDRGWAESLVLHGGGIGQTPDAWGNTYFDDRFWRNGTLTKYTGYCTDILFSGAMQFIEANKEKPFLCYIPTNAPHGPYNVAEKYTKIYRDKGVPLPRAKFYGMIENIDENLGKLLAKLDDLKLRDNTIVLFLTDNGTAAGWNEAKADGFNAGMRGTKGTPYEGGHRVPCFIRWPEKIKPADIDQLSAHFDLLPTLVDLCGIKAKYPFPLDGVSLRPLLQRTSKDWPARTLFVHSQRIETPIPWRQSTVMTARHRLINGKELYDLTTDPAQKTDIASKNPEVVKQLRQEYERWWKDISTRFEETCDIVLGSAKQNPTVLNCHDWHSEQVPWDQSSVKKMPQANGWWAVQIERAGRYRFTLRHQPAEAAFPLEATKARLKIGEIEGKAEVKLGATEVTIEVDLQQGKAKLQTFLEKDKISRGAFFVEVRRLE